LPRKHGGAAALYDASAPRPLFNLSATFWHTSHFHCRPRNDDTRDVVTPCAKHRRLARQKRRSGLLTRFRTRDEIILLVSSLWEVFCAQEDIYNRGVCHALNIKVYNLPDLSSDNIQQSRVCLSIELKHRLRLQTCFRTRNEISLLIFSSWKIFCVQEDVYMIAFVAREHKSL
jgi:hypothetical protein